jgi:hypothetical protein
MAARQIAKPKIPDSNTDKTFQVVSECFEHAANLAIDSLSQDNAQTRRRGGVQSRNPCSPTIENNSTEQFRTVRGIPWPIQGHLVFLVNFVTRMRKPLCEITVVCKKKQTFRLRVQASDVEQPREFSRQQIKDSVACVRVLPG